MSQNSSNLNIEPALWRRRVGVVIVTIVRIAACTAWTYLSVFVIGAALAGLILQVGILQLGYTQSVDFGASGQLVLSAGVYVLGLSILLIEPYAMRAMSRHDVRVLLGLGQWPRPRDMAAACLGWSGYFVLSAIFALLVAWFVTGYDSSQMQRLGFDRHGTVMDALYAFVAIVVVAPIIEEIVFRGYLQGNLRRLMPWWGGAVVTSVLFGIVHQQWNVGIDVFVLSMVACYLRERTGTIWAGVGLHMIKNMLAFYLLFMAPVWLTQLLGVS